MRPHISTHFRNNREKAEDTQKRHGVEMDEGRRSDPIRYAKFMEAFVPGGDLPLPHDQYYDPKKIPVDAFEDEKVLYTHLVSLPLHQELPSVS